MKKHYRKVGLTLWFLLAAILNVAAWNSVQFCDWFRIYIFRNVSVFHSRISNLASFSVGEIMLVIGLFLIGAFLISGICRCIFRKKERIVRFCRGFQRFFVFLLAVVVTVMSTNCFVLFHCSDFETIYMNPSDKVYTIQELAAVRAYVIEQANMRAQSFARDENGYIIYDGDLRTQAVTEMKRMGERYPLLSGYYPRPKPLAASKFFSQQYMLGYYFPFSMEANYNRQMYVVNMPATMCHELSHLKGFLYEDDANFIGYLACITSEDTFFQYSGYLSVLDYLNNALYESLGKDRAAYLSYETCSELVAFDNMFLTPQAWEEVEETALLDTETVKQASHNFVETNLNLNGVEEGLANYGKVVEYLLKYYDGVLYES